MKNFASIVNTMEDNSGIITEQTPEDTVQLSESVAEIDSAVSEIEKTNSTIDQAVCSQDGINELYNYASDSLKDGKDGLNETETKIVQITHESIMKSLGYNNVISIYSPESFSGKFNSRQITIETLESLSDKAKSIGQSIIKALKSAFDMVLGFIAKIINNRPLMIKHLTALENRVKDIQNTNSKPKEQVVKAGTVLSINNKGTLDSAYKVLDSTEENIGIAYRIVKLLSHKPQETELINKDISSIVEKIKSLPVNGKGHGILPGGNSFAVNLIDPANSKNDSGDKDGQAYNEGATRLASSLKIEVVSNGGVAEEMQAPAPKDMLIILVKAKRALEQLREVEKMRSIMAQFMSSFSKMMTSGKLAVSRNIGSEENKSAAHVTSGQNNLIQSVIRLLTKFMTTVLSQTFRAVKGAADYVSAGLRNLGKTGEKTPEAAA